MKLELKPVSEQIMVITGASSGMGLVTARMAAARGIPGSESGQPPRPREDNGLARPSNDLQERGNYPGHVMGSSLYTQASLHPAIASAVVAGAGLALSAWLRARSARHPSS